MSCPLCNSTELYITNSYPETKYTCSNHHEWVEDITTNKKYVLVKTTCEVTNFNICPICKSQPISLTNSTPEQECKCNSQHTWLFNIKTNLRKTVSRVEF